MLALYVVPDYEIYALFGALDAKMTLPCQRYYTTIERWMYIAHAPVSTEVKFYEHTCLHT